MLTDYWFLESVAHVARLAAMDRLLSGLWTMKGADLVVILGAFRRAERPNAPTITATNVDPFPNDDVRLLPSRPTRPHTSSYGSFRLKYYYLLY